MSLRTRLRIAVVALLLFIVSGLSALYLYDFSRAAFLNASDMARNIADNVKGYLLERITQDLHRLPSAPASLDQYKLAWTTMVRTDPLITAMLQRSRANAYMVANVAIAGEDGRILAASDSSTIGLPAPTLSDIEVMSGSPGPVTLLRLFGVDRNYAFLLPLGVPGQAKPILTVVVVIQSLFLRHSLAPAFRSLAAAFLAALLVSVLLGVLLPNLALRPLERVSRRIDEIRTGRFTPAESPERGEASEFAAVQSKLDLLGQQVSGARQDALTLRSNIDQLLDRLGETVLLFDASNRLTVAGHLAEQLLNRPASDLAGRSPADIFPPSTPIGALIAQSRQTLQPASARLPVLDAPSAPTLEIHVEPLEHSGRATGLLIRLRDPESRIQLERRLDLASRLAAIGRLTGGVAHEIKNPLNAIALHLEVLKSKLDGSEPEISVISREIQRLDRVVKTFLDFNRPVEIDLRALDLSALAASLLDLLAPQAASRAVSLTGNFPEPLWINADAGLLRQALLNVAVNAIEAAPHGGRVHLASFRTPSGVSLAVSDNGPGIPDSLREKIFNLYFTTKEKGSGIGLAMTFRLVQLHGGTIDVFDNPEGGATFELRFPESAPAQESRAAAGLPEVGS